MTDNDIIKALGNCNDNGTCDKCPYDGLRFEGEIDCASQMIADALDLINRQKAEIEILKGWERLLKAESHAPFIKTAKAEAVREFAEKINEEIEQALKNNYERKREHMEKTQHYDDFSIYCNGKIDCLRGLQEFTNNLVKEMAGDSDG